MRHPGTCFASLLGFMAMAAAPPEADPYHFHQAGAGMARAVNPDHGLSIAARPGGIEISLADRPGSSIPAARLTLRLAAFGRDAAFAILTPSPEVQGRRIEYRHAGLTEWYVNLPAGLEQGFTLEAAPAGPSDRPLIFEVEVLGADGPIRPGMAPGAGVTGRGVSLDVRGRLLHFGELAAFDAQGRPLPTSMRPTERGVRIEVSDQGAAYPIIVDPVISSPAWVEEGNLGGAFTGTRMEIVNINGDPYGDVLVQRIRPGSISLHLGSALGPSAAPVWEFRPSAHGSQAPGVVIDYQDVYLGGAGDVNGDGFNDMIVGFPYHNGGTGGNEGRAWVFLGSASGLAATYVWAVNGENTEDNYGWWVDGVGDVNGDGYDDVLVGAPGHGGESFAAGKVYLYYGSASGVSSTPAWTMEGTSDFASLGRRVSSAGDINADGFGDFMAAASGEGRVFVLYGSDLGVQPGHTILDDGFSGSGFGDPMDSAGDVNADGFSDVVVGAPTLSNGAGGEGGAFVFLGSLAGISTTPAWSREGIFANKGMGHAVAGAGDLNGDGFDDVLIGITSPGTSDRGEARIYLGGAGGVSVAPTWTGLGPLTNSRFGAGAHGGGDVNGDGLDDVLIGAPGFHNPDVGEGINYLYSGCLELDRDGTCDMIDNCPTIANSAQVDQDSDGRGDACDCAPADPGLWSNPSPIRDLALVSGGSGGSTSISWLASEDAGSAGTVFYDVIRSTAADDFVTAADCLEFDEMDTLAADGEPMGVGSFRFYLVRPENTCTIGAQPVGFTSSGQPRPARACP